MREKQVNHLHLAVLLTSGWGLWGMPIVFSLLHTFDLDGASTPACKLFIAALVWFCILGVCLGAIVFRHAKWRITYVFSSPGAFGVFFALAGSGLVSLLVFYDALGGSQRMMFPLFAALCGGHLFLIHVVYRRYFMPISD